MMGYWAEFAKTGNPGRGSSGMEVPWTPWGEAGQRMIVLDTTTDKGIRMSSEEEVTLAGIKAELASDPLVASAEHRCRLYVQSFVNNASLDLAEYQNFGPDGCKAFDPASFAFQ